jgi:FAD/FMN-containing dehydrogenase/Fe-S oxidoreductase
MSRTPSSSAITQLPADLLIDLGRAGLETRTDPVTRTLYSTDASIYQIEPLGVVFPRHPDHLNAAVELAARYGVPVIARGSGSGLAGQTLGEALILDCSRYLDHILEINLEEQTATVQPGVVLEPLNKLVASYISPAAPRGLTFGPDPASAERATLGGVIGNNATGAHSIVYGMTSDHVLEVEMVLGDGSMASFGQLTLEEAEHFARNHSALRSRQSALVAAAMRVRQDYAEAIRQNWTRTWRRASGYSLNYLLPWSPSAPPSWSEVRHPASGQGYPYPPVGRGALNLAALFVGAEGTLGVMRQAKIRLVPRPRHTILGVLAYDSITDASDDTLRLLIMAPSAVEMISRTILNLARSVPAYAQLIDFLPPGAPDPAALLVIEFAGDEPALLKEKVRALGPRAYVAESAAAQGRIWGVRKVGLGLLQSMVGDAKPVSFIEDITVPVERLTEYVRAVERITADLGIEATFYAHASAGCLHVRPVINLKSAEGVKAMRSITAQSVAAALQLGGIVSGEHGDGLSHSEWLENAYGPVVMEAHRLIKDAADPGGMLNPGKIVRPGQMEQNLRFGGEYRSQAWQPALNFASQVSLEGAIEMCNGAGVCRKEGGVMCPSFQATREEMHSTRGRANLLRALISGRGPVNHVAGLPEQAAKEALDLCLACKGCKAECPSGVDLAKLKYEFLDHYYRSHRRPWRDRLFGNFGVFARLGSPVGGLINRAMAAETLRGLFARFFKLAPQRTLPKFDGAGERQLRRSARRMLKLWKSERRPARQAESPTATLACLVLLDPFTSHFYPGAGQAALAALQKAGYCPLVLPVSGAGRTLISKGYLEAAKRHAAKVVAALQEADPAGALPVIGVEPSEIYTLSDEYPDLLPGDSYAAGLARRAWMIDEFLVRAGRMAAWKADPPTGQPEARPRKVLLHGHCYQKARPPADDGLPVGVAATVMMLQTAGYQVEVVDSGCCGMAGAFGYEAEHYELSMQIGELKLFPAVRAAGQETIVAACGVSCQAQIEDGAQREAIHPILLL